MSYNINIPYNDILAVEILHIGPNMFWGKFSINKWMMDDWKIFNMIEKFAP